MIKLEKTQIVGWEPAIRGMRNPMNSWEKSDSEFYHRQGECHDILNGIPENPKHSDAWVYPGETTVVLGDSDHDLMMRLANGGSVHAKYRRMIVVYVDITAPLYWWKEFDTYKVGTVANSCSTMHKIQAKEFTLEDFSCEHLDDVACCCKTDAGDPYEVEELTSLDILMYTIKALNYWRDQYNLLTEHLKDETMTDFERKNFIVNQKHAWWQMIQLLPSSYNQKRTVMLNYEVLAGIYPSRKDHKLDEWHDFCDWIKTLPYSEVIIGEKAEDGE